MAEPVSAEVRAMQQEERSRWLIVAEAQRLRASWTSVRSAVDDLAEKFDADPEDKTQAEMFILSTTLVLSGHQAKGAEAVKKMTELAKEASGGA